MDLDPDASAKADDIDVAVSIGGGERRTSAYTGTKALMMALLEDGIRAYLSPIPRVRSEAEIWASNSQNRWVFSFEVVCETLGLEPDSVRAMLRRWRANHVSACAIGGPTEGSLHRKSIRQRPVHRKVRTLAG